MTIVSQQFHDGSDICSALHSSSRRALRDDEAGLTLVEMIVVLAIIALVAALIVPNVIGRPDEARVTVANTDLRTISAALKMYRLDNGDYPTTQQGLAALSAKPTAPPLPRSWSSEGYLAQVPVDPWGNPYVYRSPAPSGGFALLSHGKDGKEGGEGLDADLTDKKG
jgi:general secretion pathway protein G